MKKKQQDRGYDSPYREVGVDANVMHRQKSKETDASAATFVRNYRRPGGRVGGPSLGAGNDPWS